ncbi:hypothetical protein ONZ45_g15626 [Pleurotus djamor]|nr:hypothetical protein ONZ45_g15626 [Pleurotus djamor]
MSTAMKKPRRVLEDPSSKEFDATDIPSLQVQINAKIDAHYAEIRRLRALHNATCAATRHLPVEILSMIFRILEDTHRYNSPLPWISVTHVCRLWRTTAINEPRLWTNLEDCRENWKPEMLHRAKTAPVHLKVQGTPLVDQFVPSAVLPCPERLRGLTWYDNADHLLTLVKPAPFLESVNLRLQSPAPLPEGFLGGSAPRLRDFHSDNVYIHLNASLFSNIRKISLKRQWHDPTTTSLKLTAFLDFLRGLPCLEDLSVDIPTEMQADVVNPAANVSTHAIRALDIGANCHWPALRQFFQSIRLDALRSIQVCSKTGWNLRDPFPDDIMKTLVVFFRSSIGAKPNCLEFDNIERARFIHSDPVQGNRFLTVKPLSLLPAILIPELEITTLHTHDALVLKESRLIKRLHFEGYTMENLTDSTLQTLPYPSLRQLHIKCRHIKPKVKTIPIMRSWLAKRACLGAKIDELWISDHNLVPKEIKLLSQVVSLVLTSGGDEVRVPQGSM